jgi:hypothetical protein
MMVPVLQLPGARLTELALVTLRLLLDSFTLDYVKQPEFKKQFGSTGGV